MHEHVHPADMAQEPGWWSHVCSAELHAGTRIVFVAGQTALRPDGSHVDADDLAAQVQQVYDNLAACLTAADASFLDVTAFRTFLVPRVDVAKFRELRNAKHEGIFRTGCAPPNTLVVCHSLAIPDLLLEIEATAVVSAGTRSC